MISICSSPHIMQRSEKTAQTRIYVANRGPFPAFCNVQLVYMEKHFCMYCKQQNAEQRLLMLLVNLL